MDNKHLILSTRKGGPSGSTETELETYLRYREAIWNAQSVAVTYHPTNRAVLFGLGITFGFMREKDYVISIANPAEHHPELRAHYYEEPFHPARLCYEVECAAQYRSHLHAHRITQARHALLRYQKFDISIQPADNESLFTFGMVFAMLRNHVRQVGVSNLDELPKTPKRSFNNLAHQFAQSSTLSQIPT